MMAKPMKTLELHYPMIQFLIIKIIFGNEVYNARSVHLAIVRVRTGPGKPGKSWNFIMAFSRTGKSWRKATSPGTEVWKFVKLG